MKNVIPKPMKRTIILLLASLILGWLLPIKAQNAGEVIISGIVKDKDSRKKLENVNIAVIGSNVGTVTNADGAFTLKVSQSEIKQGLLASYIGYMNTRVSVDEIMKVQGNQLVITMRPSTEWLNEVNVFGGKPRDLVEKAIAKIGQNYSDKDNLYAAFYRETVQKGRRYIGVAEAVMDVYKTDYKDRRTVRDRSKLIRGRRLMSQRSKDTLSVKVAGGPLVPIYLDIVKNGEDLLNITNLQCYDFIMDKPVLIDNRMQYVVAFVPRMNLEYALYMGKLYIDQETLSFTRAEFEMDVSDKAKAVRTILQKKPAGLRFKPLAVTYLVTYRQQGDKTYLNYIRNDVRFKCDWKKRLFSSTYTTSSEMVMVDREEEIVDPIKAKNSFKYREVFYDVVDEYWDADYWEDYNIIEPTESLESAVNKLRKRNK
ncbi:MAG: carboxypeptidase-like regulatory domain-containing protein [Bacteroidaceae bacterium]|nr:carboxypeptidase-like regulatory domain-containing protein [Bacteroidaceae bacterium]